MPIKVLVPLTVRLEVLNPPLVITGLVPVINKEPMVKLLRRSSVALLRVSKVLVLPTVPLPLTCKVPALTVVAPV